MRPADDQDDHENIHHPSALTEFTKQDLKSQITHLIHHLVNGEIKKGKSFGIHFFIASQHRVAEMINPPDEKGIWEARLEIKNGKTNAWVKKKRSSTLFPVSWTESDLAIKLEEALFNSTVNTSYKKTGITSCGIKIIFIFQKNELTTCYPVYE